MVDGSWHVFARGYKRSARQRQWDMSVVGEENSQLKRAVAVRDARMKQPALSTRACGRVSTWTQGQAVVAQEPWLPCGLRQCTWRARRDTGLGGGLVRRASWSWVEASRTFGRVREAACDR